ncbi:MAG: SixA phosphatase family protein [Caulobacterales bacterium]
MRRLILFRHAKAEPRAAGGDDFDRPLAPRGRDDAALMGRVLAAEGLIPDLALVSSARRTAETWTCARDSFPHAGVELRRELYNAGPEAIWDEVRQAADEGETLMVIGHNPGLHELAVELLIDASASPVHIEKVAAKFPTATAVALTFDEAGHAAFDGFFLAKDQGGEGEG